MESYIHYGQYCIVDTEERGRILYCHTSMDNYFELGIHEIYRLYVSNHCDCIITCHPKRHWNHWPILAEKLNILYKWTMDYTYNGWGNMYETRVITVQLEVYKEKMECV